MSEFSKKVVELATTYGGKIIGAIIVLIVGCIIIKAIKKALAKAKNITKLDKTVQGFVLNFVTVLLYAILIICVIGILGIPMASVTAVLASCGLAVGLALQGALGNLAGGIMILIFRPFRVGDYVNAAGAEGVVKDVALFYTTILTVDNKCITVPNGSLMNANVTNFSSEELRRVDLDFKVANTVDANVAKGILLKASEETAGVKTEPAPFARMTAVNEHNYVFTVRAWCDSAKYWDTYFDLIENCTAALAANGIGDPEDKIAVRVINK